MGYRGKRPNFWSLKGQAFTTSEDLKECTKQECDKIHSNCSILIPSGKNEVHISVQTHLRWSKKELPPSSEYFKK